MKKIIAFVFTLLFITTQLKADDSGTIFVKALTDDIIKNVLSSNIPDDEKIKIFHDRFQKDLDITTIGKHVVGTYWKKASKEEQQEFIDAFFDFATKSWADKFNLYTGQELVFTGTRPAKSNQLFVDSTVKGNPPAEVSWRLKKEGNTYKITDIIIEHVSMVKSYRDEYVSFLQKNGGKLPVLTKTLKEKSATFKFTGNK